ncbi:hypothetical protein HYW72_00590 [Candidatus Nomurabacteria bacterium]|nr:hypothetical protein [Candidatus Nomurabacteria bacterium]
MENKSENKICQNCQKEFTIDPDDFGFYEKIKVPPPTFCPECRLQRRLLVRNERNLYHRECGLCGKPIFSMYSAENKFLVYCQLCWWGDQWDPIIFGKNYDFSRSFFAQLRELLDKVPRPNLLNSNTKNSDYCNYIADGKNCYLCFGSIEVENCLYGCPYESKYCVDTYLARESEYCYQCMDCEKLSNSSFCQECATSFNLLYCFDCKNCNDCIGCSGLRNKGYYIFNQPYSKEDFLKKKEKILAEGYRGSIFIAEEFKKTKMKTPHRFAMILQCKDVSGDHIVSSKNAFSCFDVKRAENSRYSIRMIDAKDSSDTNYCEYIELCYDYLGFWKIQNTKFSNTCGESSDLIYADFCSGSSNLFGCIGLRHKQHCILNQQYTKEEYEKLVPKVIQHMNDMPYVDSKGRTYRYGEFFPPELSPFCYNETIAQEYFPLTKAETLKQGYKWKEREERNYKIDVKNEDIPNDIKEVKDEIINQVIECEHQGKCNEQCTEAFKIIEAELQFYRRMNLPLPHLCPNCRHYQRLKQRNPLKLWHRKCMKEGCPNEFETSYAPDRPEIVYCEKCYQQEVY